MQAGQALSLQHHLANPVPAIGVRADFIGRLYIEGNLQNIRVRQIPVFQPHQAAAAAADNGVGQTGHMAGSLKIFPHILPQRQEFFPVAAAEAFGKFVGVSGHDDPPVRPAA